MDFNKVIIVHELSEKCADSGLEFHDSLIGWYTQINDPVVQSNILFDNHCFWFVLSFLLSFIRVIWGKFSFLVQDWPRGILNLEWKHWRGPVHTEDLKDI